MVDLEPLEPRQGSGTYVSGVDPTELLEVRDRLEPHAARLAARNRTAIDESAFTRILEDLKEGVPGAYTELRQAIAGARKHPRRRPSSVCSSSSTRAM